MSYAMLTGITEALENMSKRQVVLDELKNHFERLGYMETKTNVIRLGWKREVAIYASKELRKLGFKVDRELTRDGCVWFKKRVEEKVYQTCRIIRVEKESPVCWKLVMDKTY